MMSEFVTFDYVTFIVSIVSVITDTNFEPVNFKRV
jgi:hypothetical protein